MRLKEHDEIVALFRRYLEHLGGKHNQKSHGNRFGSVGDIKANVKRLGKDKEALKRMAARAKQSQKVKQAVSRQRSERQYARKVATGVTGAAPKVLAAGLNPKEEARRFNLPDDFYREKWVSDFTTFGVKSNVYNNVPNEKYLTPEYTKAKDSYDAAVKRQSSNRTKKIYRKQMDAEWEKIITAAQKKKLGVKK